MGPVIGPPLGGFITTYASWHWIFIINVPIGLIGIIGAVLGLIQVMKHLENIDEVGKGIAVAFVATIYGVGAANLFFLPMARWPS